MAHLTSSMHIFYGVWTLISFFVHGIFIGMNLKKEKTLSAKPTHSLLGLRN